MAAQGDRAFNIPECFSPTPHLQTIHSIPVPKSLSQRRPRVVTRQSSELCVCVTYFCLHHSGTHNSTAQPIKNIFRGNRMLVSSELMLGDLVVLVTL